MLVKDCIRNARYKLGLNQREFADLVCISKASISLYETGERTPGFPALRRIVDKMKEFNITMEYTDLIRRD